MLPLERQNAIMEILSKRKAETVENLCKSLYSSGATIRRDLKLLEHEGFILRTHGGAVLIEGSKDTPLILRESENKPAKNIIAKKALSYIKDGQTIFFDSSSTCSNLARQLIGYKNLKIVTNSLKTISILSEIEGVEVYCTGGRLRDTASSFVGQHGMNFLSHFHADYTFMSCRGIDLDAGVTESSEEATAMKLACIKNSDHTVLLCDSSKLGKKFFFKICDVSDLDKIISDSELPDDYLDIIKYKE